jgi:hypothetical protein
MSLALALSPYHLATRESPAMAALILADHVVTLLPQPAEGSSRKAVGAAVIDAPHYLRLMESWRWSSPLWTAGVISSTVDHDNPAEELAGVYQSIAEDEDFASLRPLTRGAEQRAAESSAKALDFMAADLLRGGPDPGINIPICAALDRFALRHDLCVVRSGIASIAQRAESRMGQRLFSIAIPILARAGGGRIQLLRHDLHAELSALRTAMHQALAATTESLTPPALAKRTDALHSAAETYTAAFTAWSVEGASGDDENAQRITTGYVSLTAMSVPADAILRSSRAAIRALVPNGRAQTDEAAPTTERLHTIVIREMSLRPE